MTYDELKALAGSGAPLRGGRAREAVAAIEAQTRLFPGARLLSCVHYPAIQTVWIRFARPVDRSRLVGLKVQG